MYTSYTQSFQALSFPRTKPVYWSFNGKFNSSIHIIGAQQIYVGWVCKQGLCHSLLSESNTYWMALGLFTPVPLLTCGSLPRSTPPTSTWDKGVSTSTTWFRNSTCCHHVHGGFLTSLVSISIPIFTSLWCMLVICLSPQVTPLGQWLGLLFLHTQHPAYSWTTNNHTLKCLLKEGMNKNRNIKKKFILTFWEPS